MPASGDDNAKELQRREERLFSAKQNLDSLYQELAYNFYPERADFLLERALGAEFATDLFDSEPVRCRRDLGNARAAMLRPAGQEWYKAKSPDKRLNDQPANARWFDWLNEQSRGLIYHPDTGFVRAEKECDQDLVTFGNAVKTVESEIDARGQRILIERCWHLRDCAWLDDALGIRQDFFARRFKASARHIRQQFPEAVLSDNIKDALEQNPDQEFKLCHVMMRADEYDYYQKPRGRKMPWVSVYYDSEHKMLLRERPSERFRYIVERWGTLSGSQYGFSPASMTALPDARGLQTMAQVLLEAGEKSLDPPLVATQRAIKGEVNQGAGQVTWKDKEYDERWGASIEPLLPHGINPQIGIELINRVTFALRDTWYLTKLTLPPQTGGRTAYEAQELVQEFIRANIPLFEPWQAAQGITLTEIFGVLMDMRAFGDATNWPPEMDGKVIDFAFSNPLQDAIERVKVHQAEVVLGLLAGAAKINPAAPGVSRIDIDEVVESATRGSGAPADWIKDDTQIAAEKQAAQDAARVQGNQQDIVGALHGAGMAADVVNSGLSAAQKLRELNQPAVDGSAVFGPT